MRKLMLFTLAVLMTSFFAITQVDARPGGMPDLTTDSSIQDCGCPPCCPQPCSQPAVKKEPARPAPKPAPAPPAPMKEKVTISLNVEFDTDKAVVKEKYNDDIKRVADFMKEYPDTKATIEGHTDNVGNAAYNQKLSEKRANSVRQYLIDKFGIDGSRLTAVGYGDTHPIAPNDTDEGRQKNRRVDAVIESMRTVQ